jgi:hypothetical protein
MKTVAWLAGIGTMLAAAAYMVVSLNRWEWNRALFFGLILLIAEVALATALVLRKLGELERRGRSDDGVLDIVQGSRPSSPDRFGWLKDSAKGQMNVFITFLVGGGVILSALAWVVDRVASRTATPAAERRLARSLRPIAYPSGGLLVDDVTALADVGPDADDHLHTLLGIR